MAKDSNQAISIDSKKLDMIGRVLIHVLIFLVPWVFLPTQLDFYESAKNLLLAVVVALGMLVMVLKIYREGRISFVRTAFDRPLLFWVLVTLAGTIFSLNFYTSFLGYHSRITNSLIGVLLLAMFYFLATNFIKGKEELHKMTRTWTVTVSLFSLFVVLQDFSLLNWLWKILNLSGLSFTSLFNPLGSSELVPFLILTALPALTGSILVKRSEAGKKMKVIAIVLLLINLLAFSIGLSALPIILKVILALLVLGVFAFQARLYKKSLHEHKLVFSMVMIVFAVFMILFNVQLVSSKLGLPGYPIDPVLDLQTSWAVTAKATFSDGLKSLLIGNGPETFALNFTRFKPIEFNLSPYWDVRFTSNSIGILNFIHSYGLFGVAIVGYVLLNFVKLVKKVKNDEKKLLYMSPFIMSSALVLSFIFLASFDIVLWIYLALSLAMLTKAAYVVDPAEEKDRTILISAEHSSDKRPSFLLARVSMISYIVMIIIFTTFLVRNYASDFHYRVSSNATNSTTALQSISRAISEDPSKNYLHLLFAAQAYSTAGQLLSQEKPTDEQTNTALALMNQAVYRLQTATDLNPYEVETYEYSAQIYGGIYNLTGSSRFAQDTLASLRNSIAVDPYTPRHYVNLGLFLFRIGNSKEAEVAFANAYQLRGDYAYSVLSYGSFLETDEERYDDAKKLYETTLAIPTVPNTPLGEELTKRLGSLGENKLEVQTTPTTTPTPGQTGSDSEQLMLDDGSGTVPAGDASGDIAR